MAVQLGKDLTIAGVSNARSVTVDSQVTEIDCTAIGDTTRQYKKGLAEQTVQVECVDDPGVAVGSTFTLSGTNTGNVSYIVTSVSQSEPLDDIITYTVSGQRTVTP